MHHELTGPKRNRQPEEPGRSIRPKLTDNKELGIKSSEAASAVGAGAGAGVGAGAGTAANGPPPPPPLPQHDVLPVFTILISLTQTLDECMNIVKDVERTITHANEAYAVRMMLLHTPLKDWSHRPNVTLAYGRDYLINDISHCYIQHIHEQNVTPLPLPLPFFNPNWNEVSNFRHAMDEMIGRFRLTVDNILSTTPATTYSDMKSAPGAAGAGAGAGAGASGGGGTATTTTRPYTSTDYYPISTIVTNGVDPFAFFKRLNGGNGWKFDQTRDSLFTDQPFLNIVSALRQQPKYMRTQLNSNPLAAKKPNPKSKELLKTVRKTTEFKTWSNVNRKNPEIVKFFDEWASNSIIESQLFYQSNNSAPVVNPLSIRVLWIQWSIESFLAELAYAVRQKVGLAGDHLLTYIRTHV